MSTDTPADKLEFRAEVRQLLDILAHSLYTEREIFLRELISNASDALNRVQFEMLTNRDMLDPDAELKIMITGSEDGRTFTIADTGIGMTRDELVENLGTIAHSGAAAFLQSLKEGAKPGDVIGRFGVGFYSVLMVADEVRVTSRSHRPEATAWTWTTSGGDSYTLVPADKADRGTTIVVRLKEDASEYAKDWRLEEVIHKHSDFVAFPIYLKDRAINRQTALWRQSPASVTDEQANDFYRQLTLEFEQPLLRVHLNTDAPVQIHALLYVPAKAERGVVATRREDGLKLYSRKVLIQDYCKDLLPNHFRFVQGVVDSEDLPLSVSREAVQSSKVMERIKTALAHKLLDELKKLAADDKDKYARFWSEFGPFIKEGVALDPAGREKLYPILRFHSSKTADGEWASLNDYIGRVQPAQKSIYYLLADSLQSAAISPHLDYFRGHNMEVLYLTDPIDHFLLNGLTEYEGFKLQSVDDATLDLPKDDQPASEAEDLPAGEFEGLIAKVKAQLGDKVVEVRASERLVDSPARLVVPNGGGPAQDMARIRRLLNQPYDLPKRVMELNRRHPLIRRLAELVGANDSEPIVSACVDQLYENALLIEGLHPNPAEMLPRIQQLMEAAVRK
ncbi:MAG: molecular chaperone HtpG [Chloroflexi bacterium]|nr:molecular chaperone HtpG [Chloroflexota bacterium]